MKKEIYKLMLVLAAMVMFAGSARGYPLTAGLNGWQVVPSSFSTGRGTCKVTGYDADGSFGPSFNVNCSFSGMTDAVLDADIRYGLAGQNGESYCWEKRVKINDPNEDGSGSLYMSCTRKSAVIEFSPFADKGFYIVLQTSEFPDGEVRGQIKPVTLDSDLDGQGKTEIWVFRSSNHMTYAYSDTMGGPVWQQLEWGWDWDVVNPFLADFDGDAIADWSDIYVGWWGAPLVVYRRSSTGEVVVADMGDYDDHYAFGDYNGDGIIDKAAFSPSRGRWHIWENEFGDNWHYEFWGKAGDRPCPGDYDGDGKTDLCVVRNEDGYLAWYIKRSSDQGTYVPHWGLATDTLYPQYPVDVDADGLNDILVSRNENGLRVFYVMRSSDYSTIAFQWGLASDAVRIGDYDGDGKTDFAALREIDGRLIWFINRSTSEQPLIFQWGLAGDQ